ncbi:MAG: phage scaffolding protein [Peptoniphilaceae bacterium]
MDWLKELLKAQGLEEEAINKIVGSYKTESVKHVMPKDKFNEVNDENKQLKKDIKERDTQLEDLKGKATSNEDLQAEITRLQEENKTNKENYENDLYNTKLNNEIDKNLLAAKAKDLKIAKAVFNLEDVKLEDGKLTGFEEQLKSVQESHSYLFGGEENPSGTGGSMGNKGKQNNEDVDPFLKGLGLV